ncbi:ribonuclease HI [Sporolactobacillus shoreicorticis]|uniref:ribonuclease H n=1 Tax=Sporolactobacillus shoreicorticis TaxID=1923877 RepID=A0ABW5S4K0_9BACL|nr:ribonuclease HI [Sporolactobacillus shoreicorticis]MCO7128130.1 ribonuclease HI [Sporolactobacillus shoreicorticis]
MDEIIIYCDGGCRGNQSDHNVGGWGAILRYGDHVKELHGGMRNTTNNVMELTAAIRALESLKSRQIPVAFYIDSAYVVNGMNSWISGWIKKGWKTAGGKAVKNKELWIRLNDLARAQEKISFNKVRGHHGVEYNERADQIANLAMDEVEKE